MFKRMTSLLLVFAMLLSMGNGIVVAKAEEPSGMVINLTQMESIVDYDEYYYVVLEELSDIEIIANGSVEFCDSGNYQDYVYDTEENCVVIEAEELKKCYLEGFDLEYPLMLLEEAGLSLQNEASALVYFDISTEEGYYGLIIEILPSEVQPSDAVIYSGEGLKSPWGEANWAVTELVLKGADDYVVLAADTSDEYSCSFYVYLDGTKIHGDETFEVEYTVGGEDAENAFLDEWSDTSVELVDGEGSQFLTFMDSDYNDLPIDIYYYTVKLSLNQEEVTVEEGEEATLTVVTGLDESSAEALLNNVRWTSSNEEVVSVEGGVVSAKAVGKANVTAEVGSISLTCPVTVEKALAPEDIDVNFRMIGIEAPNESISDRGSWQLGLVGQSAVTYGDYQNLVYETWISTTSVETTNKTWVTEFVKQVLAANGYTEGTTDGSEVNTYCFSGTPYVFSPEAAGSEKVYRHRIKVGSGAFIKYSNPYGPNGDWYITLIRGDEMFNYAPANVKEKLQDGDTVILHYAVEPDFELSSGSYAQQEAYDDYIMYCLNAADVSPAEKKQIENVEALITAIGNVSAASGDAIAAAEVAYNALSEKLQALVSNAETLTKAREDYDKIINAQPLDAPVLDADAAQISCTSVTLAVPVSEQDENATVLYNISLDGGETWEGLQEENVFEDLTPGKTYQFKARFISSDLSAYKNSADSAVIEVTPDHAYADATCDAPKTCACGATEGEAKGHTYGDLIPEKEAVHTNTKLEGAVAAHYYCIDCGTYFTAEKEATTLEALTGEAPVHEYADATCNDPKTCACGATEGEAKGHTYGDLILEKEAVHTNTKLEGAVAAHYNCVDCGTYFTAEKEATTLEALTGEAPVHEYADATCNDPKTCACGATEGEAKGHDMKQTAAKVEATCEKDGKEAVLTCANGCGKTEGGETIKAKGHTEVEINGKDATCTEKGLSAGKKCSVCGTVTVAQNEIPAKGHTEKIVDAKEATWYAEGYTGDTYCSVCDVLIKKGSVIEKTKDQPENPFVDVKEDKFYYEPVLWAVEAGVTTGTTATTFAPEDFCTRGQIVTFLWRAAGEPESSSTEHPFTDLDEKAFYYKAVLWAVEKGITNGMTPTTFEPGKECTRGQVVTFLHRFAGEPAPNSKDHPFTDVNEKSYYYDAMLWAVEKNITNGFSKTEFAPDNTCTRGQIVTFLFRYMTQK